MTTLTTHPSSEHQNLDGRIELWGYYDCEGRNSFYADEVPWEIRMYKVLIILGCIFLTPITLLCCIPIICSLKKTQDILERGDIPAARKVYRLSVWCCVLVIWWSTFFILAVITGTIVLAVHMNQ